MKKKKVQKGSVTLNIKGKSLKLEIEAPAKPVTARRMLPTFQKVTDDFVQFGIENESSNGRQVSCGKGCSACCYQAIPIAPAEAFALAELIESFDEEKKERLERRFEDATSKLREIGWFEEVGDLTAGDSQSRQKLGMDYFGLNLPCPFLEDDLCSIHDQRPMSCREYVVTSPAENCGSPTPETIDMVSLPTTPSRIFREVVDESGFQGKNYLPLVSLLEFVEKSQESGKRFTGEQWVSKFFQAISRGPRKEQKTPFESSSRTL